MKTVDKDKLWMEYKSNPTQEIREQLIIEYAQLVKLVAEEIDKFIKIKYED